MGAASDVVRIKSFNSVSSYLLFYFFTSCLLISSQVCKHEHGFSTIDICANYFPGIICTTGALQNQYLQVLYGRSIGNIRY